MGVGYSGKTRGRYMEKRFFGRKKPFLYWYEKAYKRARKIVQKSFTVYRKLIWIVSEIPSQSEYFN